MSRLLSDLLGAAEPAFSLMIRDLELASGGNGVDIRLATDIRSNVRQKSKELGLDPNDSSGKEIYHALVQLAKTHDEHLAKALGAKDTTSVSEILPLIQAAPTKLGLQMKCWAVKPSVAKRLLMQRQPKNLMKSLGYRSVESLVKRESVAEIYAALRFAEDEQWFMKFNGLLSKLQVADFETRDVEVITLNPRRWGSLSANYVKESGDNLCVSHEMGVILLLPLPVINLKGLTITVLPLVLEAINEIKMYSAFFKLRQVRSNFGQLVAASVLHDIGYSAQIAGQPLHWRVMQRHFSRKETDEHLDVFEPYISAEDLNWRKTEELLFRLEPSLSFWRGLDYVGLKTEDLPVSFNLLDVAISLVNKLEYGEQSVEHHRQALWNEIFIRYMGEQNVENEVLQQLSSELLGETKHQRKVGV